MLVLGIETSCDETAAAVVADGRDVRSNVVLSQVAEHSPYGGVVPEIASRCHVEALPHVVRDALDQADCTWADIDLLACTRGPGLASSLLVGWTAAKALSLRLEKPLVDINHLQGHLYSVFLGPDAPEFDDDACWLVLLVSGGHTCLVRLMGPRGPYELLGRTLDDAAGEALDKGAQLLGLGYPGGPAIERAAVGGDPRAVSFPSKARIKNAGKDGEERYDFSFSGVKTALLYFLKDHPDAGEPPRLRDICASYQDAVFDALIHRAGSVIAHRPITHLACVGGVARNARLREKLETLARETKVNLHMAPLTYCTDNAAMIAGMADGLPVPENGYAMRLDIEPSLSLG